MLDNEVRLGEADLLEALVPAVIVNDLLVATFFRGLGELRLFLQDVHDTPGLLFNQFDRWDVVIIRKFAHIDSFFNV